MFILYSKGVYMICIYIYTYKYTVFLLFVSSLSLYIYRLPPLPPTSKTRVTEDWMLGAPCCSRWGPLGLDGDDLGLHFRALGLIWLTAWKALGGMWTPLGQTGCSNELFGTPVQAGASI